MNIVNILYRRSPLFDDGGGYSAGHVKAALDTAEMLNSLPDVRCTTLVRLPQDEDRIKRAVAVGHQRGTQGIRAYIQNTRPDYVLIHQLSSGVIDAVLSTDSVKLVCIDHTMPTTKMLIAWESLHQQLNELQRIGRGRVLTVSDVGKELKEAANLKSGIPLYYDGVVNFNFVTDELSKPILPHNNKAITIGRSHYNKMPNKIHTLLRQRLINDYTIYTNTSENPSCQKWFDTNIASKPEILAKTRLNAKREEVIQSLRESMICVSTSATESAGITAFEALCYGVPVLLMCGTKLKHASTSFVPHGRGKYWEYYNRRLTLNETKSFIEYCESADREAISTYIRQEYSKDKVAKRLLSGIIGE